ncbi:phosphonate metabolism protein PhnP [Alkalimarinus alittae]|uniref:Phosphonate metabolism protein PhnP n=1 Tax=Alkalimarinus alittae TaxID=2961619 RepID=A0ABY6N2H0_9ALTE|nr:phosphonate metabolism protein PhnP [Alkalimarinus alittae]UZE96249.1 phosphonate metabolism protein PhnP [Alkalimarinus alittae]
MNLRFQGTGDARQVPVYGCDCKSCYLARVDKTKRRGPSGLLLETDSVTLLLDAGQTDLAERFPPDTLTGILLTHYHMDHVAGLFHLRWGVNTQIPVWGPNDENGCDDLFKHPGILDFKSPLEAFSMISFGRLNITPIPLNHSKPCLGFCVEHEGQKFAYLTDTVGLPDNSRDFLAEWNADTLIIDCSHPPQNYGSEVEKALNHNDWRMVELIISQLNPRHTWLTHISHEMDEWLLNNKLPFGVSVAYDDLTLEM